MALENKVTLSGLEDISAFKALIASWAHSYTRVVVSLVAISEKQKWTLYAGRISFGLLPVEPRLVSTDRLLAIRRELKLDADHLEQFIDSVFEGRLEVDPFTVNFAARESAGNLFGTNFYPYEGGPIAQARSAVLRVFGQNFEHLHNKDEFDLDLMAGAQPYASFVELLSDFGVNDGGGLGGYLEIVGNVPSIVDLEQSSLKDGTALVVLKCLPDLDKSGIQLGVQEIEQGVIGRFAVGEEQFQWVSEDGFLWGRLSLNTPNANVLRLFVSYAGHLLSHCWVGDPLRSPNLRRTVHNCFDPELQTVRDMLLKEPDKRQDSREYEVAVGWLFWMLGFSPIAWVGSRRLSDAPDLVVQSNDGRIYVVEATTGTLRVENKLPKLMERTAQIRSAFSRQGVPPTVTPILCTSLEEGAILADLDHARRLGVVVLNGWHLESFLDRTIVYPDSNLVATEFDAMLESQRQANDEVST